MKQDKTLHKIVQKLKRDELIRYASNLGLKLDEELDMSKLRKAYVEFILSHPKELLLMLPMADMHIIKKAKDIKVGESVVAVDDRLKPIMVMYGLADMDVPQEDFFNVTIAEDLQPLLVKHIDWAWGNEYNRLRMSVELIAEGLANVLGIVTQDEIRKHLKELLQTDSDEKAAKLLDVVRHYSLLLDSMEYVEDLENWQDKDIRFVSRYGWEDRRKMEQFIIEHSKNIDSTPEFSVEELTRSSGSVLPVVPNLKMDEFMHFLTCRIGLDQTSAYFVCFNLWYYKIHYGEESLDDKQMELYFLKNVLTEEEQELTDRVVEEWMQHLAEFANNMPLWHLRGFTAADYSAEAFVSKLSTEEPLGTMLRKLKKEVNLIKDILNAKEQIFDQTKQSKEDNPWAVQKIGRNDPCPCGSGLKFKKCHGKGV
ncbi:SEC-C domain-containing protein [uncultured Prevotella sp.]|uniref:YecA family protein n=1 Tax=uncultured Prevotella sp. TaxID=159272 RepID=UPI002583C7A0|nr:SEC-C domain-containing protein [uncultured Prevotella sp.]